MDGIGADWDTRLGGDRRDFPSTCWSRLLDNVQRGEEGRQAEVQELATFYWKPIYAYVRLQWAKTNEEAKDLTQDFFLWMMESDFLAKADPDRGRFRSFVKVALKNYLAHEHEKRGRQKRGGDRRTVGLEEAFQRIDGDHGPEPSGGTPEEAMDLAWRDELLGRALGRLEDTCRREGKDRYFEVFRDFHLSGSDGADYRTAAARHGISEADVSNYLMSARKRLRSILTGLVAETVRGEAELREELEALFGRRGP